MLAEFGFICLLLTLSCSFFLVLLPSLALYCKADKGLACYVANNIKLSFYLSYGQAFCTSAALVFLARCFAVDDFSLAYVASHSNSQLPLFYKIAATWGGHEGSMLFWLFALNLWVAIFAFCHRPRTPIFQLEAKIILQSLAILGFISLIFSLFLIGFSNPFARLIPVAFEGSDLNPMLQDIGLILHPPLLYLGYVGFALCFALTLAMLLQGKFTPTFARLMAPWVLAPWGFLTLGILLGAWWAYYELGWGGWWFWDPVENASLMPWLLALGLLHNLKINQQKGLFIYWSLLFALSIFSFSILGTFIVRSGALSSVHSFAIDSQRGFALLLLFSTLTMGALIIFTYKIRPMPNTSTYYFFSQATFTLIANILLSLATFCVFLGTFYPMFYQAMGWGSISVGAPYFNQFFLPLLLTLVLLMLLVCFPLNFSARLSASCSANISLGKICRQIGTMFYPYGLYFILSLMAAYGLEKWLIQQNPQFHFSLPAFIWLTLAFALGGVSLLKIRPLNARNMPWILAHFAVALAIFAATCSSYFATEKGLRLAPGENIQFNQFQLHYQERNDLLGPNYSSEQAHFVLSKDQHKIADLYPEKRHYHIRNMQMSEIGLYSSVLGDIYIVMGDNLHHGVFTFRIQYKPFLIWLWVAGILMALAAFWAALQSLNNAQQITASRGKNVN